MKINLPKFNYNKIVHHFTISVNFLFVGFLLMNYFLGIAEAWGGLTGYLFYFIIAINTLFFALKIKRIPEKDRGDSKMIYYFSHFFLLTLVIVVINQFLKNAFVIEHLSYISAVSVALGFLTFYTYRNKVEKEIEDETVLKEKREKERFDEFGEKFPFWNRIPVLRRVVRWMYKEGWWYSVGLILILILFLGLRLYSMDYIDGSDNYNDVAVKGLYENGHSFYKYSVITTQLMLT